MNADHRGSGSLDLGARAAHAASLDHVSPRVQAQLAQRRRAALSPRAASRRTAWPWATAAVAGVALVFALQLRMPMPDAGPTTPPGATEPVRIAAVEIPPVADTLLAEDPDLYLWLASNEPPTYVE